MPVAEQRGKNKIITDKSVPKLERPPQNLYSRGRGLSSPKDINGALERFCDYSALCEPPLSCRASLLPLPVLPVQFSNAIGNKLLLSLPVSCLAMTAAGMRSASREVC